MDTFAPFKSRSEALRLYNAMIERGLSATIINTPRMRGLSCGLSVLFNGYYADTVKNIINSQRLTSFGGLFRK